MNALDILATPEQVQTLPSAERQIVASADDSIIVTLPAPVAGAARIVLTPRPETLRSIFETLERTGLACSYQGWRFTETFLRELARDNAVMIAAALDVEGRPLALLPLRLQRTLGVRVARFPGGGHANFGLGLWDRTFASRLTTSDTRALLSAIAGAVPGGIDLFAFANVPTLWQGVVPPLARLPHLLAPSAGFGLALEADPENVFARALSAHARKRLRKKRAAIEKRGALRFGQAQNDEEAAYALSCFFTWKGQRFAELGVTNPFADEETRAFLRALASRNASDEEPGLRLYTLHLNDELIALLGVGVAGGQMSGMINAIGYGDFRKDSPGDLVIQDTISAACRLGLKGFDLGCGEARYKDTLCDEEIPLVAVFVPQSFVGRCASLALMTRSRLKRLIKRSAPLWAVVERFRKLRASLT